MSKRLLTLFSTSSLMLCASFLSAHAAHLPKLSTVLDTSKAIQRPPALSSKGPQKEAFYFAKTAQNIFTHQSQPVGATWKDPDINDRSSDPLSFTDSSDGTLTIESTGNLNVSTDTALSVKPALAATVKFTLNNNGTMQTTNFNVINGYAQGIDGALTLNINNAGSIFQRQSDSNHYSILVNTTASKAKSTTTIINGDVNGALSARIDNGISIDGGVITNYPNSSITQGGASEAIAITKGTGNTITNEGTIDGLIDATGTHIINTGHITASKTITNALVSLSELSIITNGVGGSITTDTQNAISFSEPGAQVINAGVIEAKNGKAIVFAKNGNTGENQLTLQTGSVITGEIDGSDLTGVGNALTLEGEGVINNSIVSFNTLQVNAQTEGVWILQQNLTIKSQTKKSTDNSVIIDGAFEVGSAATLQVQDGFSQNIRVDSSGVLGGGGTIAANIHSYGGLIRPGHTSTSPNDADEIDTLHFEAGYDTPSDEGLASGTASFKISADSNGQLIADKIQGSGGTLNFQKTTIQAHLIPLPDAVFPSIEKTVTLISVTGGVQLNLPSTITSTPTIFSGFESLFYNAKIYQDTDKNLKLDVNIKAGSQKNLFDVPGLSENASHVAVALSKANNTKTIAARLSPAAITQNDIFSVLITSPTAASLEESLDAFVPEIYGAFDGMVLDAGYRFADVIHRKAITSGSCNVNAPFCFWSDTHITWTSNDGQNGQSRQTSRAYGGSLGTAYHVLPQLVVGGSFGYERGSGSVQISDQGASLNNIQAAAYANYQLWQDVSGMTNGPYANAAFIYNYGFGDVRRTISLRNLPSVTLKNSAKSHLMMGSMQGGYSYVYNGVFAIEPYLRFDYAYETRASVDEGPNLVALQIDSQNTSSERLYVGTKVTLPIGKMMALQGFGKGDVYLNLALDAAWMGELGSADREINYTLFANNANKQSLVAYAAGSPKNQATYGATLRIDGGQGAVSFMRYSGSAGGNAVANSIAIGFSLAW